MVSITSRGPVSGGGSGVVSGCVGGAAGFVSGFASGFGFSTGARAVSVLRGVVVLLGVGRREERVVRGDGRVFSVVSAGFSALGFGDSTGLASGVGWGSGVGAAATSAGGGSGSAILAPAELTRVVLRPVADVSVFGSVGVSVSAMSGPPTIGSNEPPKCSR